MDISEVVRKERKDYVNCDFPLRELSRDVAVALPLALQPKQILPVNQNKAVTSLPD